MINKAPIPAGYSSLSDALARAADNWGTTEQIARLRGLLRHVLSSWRSDQRGDLHPVNPEFWGDPNSERILLIDQFSDPDTPELSGRIVFSNGDLDEHLPWTTQRLRRERASRSKERLVSGVPTAQDAVASRPKHPGGRPPEIDWDEIWIEIVRLANLPDGLPERHELKKHIEQWLEDTGRRAGNTMLNGKLSKLYETLAN